MSLILIFLTTTLLEAKEVQVNYKLMSFKINYTETSVSYTGSNVELSLKKKACNEYLIKRFQSKMSSVLKSDFLPQYKPDTYSLTIDNVKKYDSLNSPRAQFFENFDDYFKAIKIEEALSCKRS